jgi:hypothetical protein
MQDEVFSSHIDRQIDHLISAIEARLPDFVMAVHECQIGRPVKTKSDFECIEFGAYLGPFPRRNALREMGGIIEANLDQAKAMLLREAGQTGEISPEIRKSETAFDRSGRVFGQVLRSFFLAAGKRTLFNISL